MNFRADLHVHSTHSDGSCTPQELVKEAKQAGLSGLCITDHDSLSAYPKVFEDAEAAGISMIPGIELSTDFEDESIHLLGYSFAYTNSEIQELCRRHKARRRTRNERILQKLQKLGIHIEMEQLYKEGAGEDHTVGRPHIALLLIEKGVVRSVQEAFDKYLGEQKAAYDPGEPICIAESIDVIHQAGGLAVLAHPHLIKRKRVVKKILRLPLDGIEVYYARMSPSQELPWLQIAKERNWIATGGSDYHGTIKPFNQLGSSWVDEKTFGLLHAHFKKSLESQARA